MLAKDSALAYKERRWQELEDKRTELIVYGQAEAIRDLLKVHQDAMQPVSHGKVVRKKRYHDKATGEEREEIEYDVVVGMMDHKAAIHATVEAIRIQGKHPDQQAQGAGVPVSININTEWRDPDPTKVVNASDHMEPTEPPESEEEPPCAVIIGRK